MRQRRREWRYILFLVSVLGLHGIPIISLSQWTHSTIIVGMGAYEVIPAVGVKRSWIGLTFWTTRRPFSGEMDRLLCQLSFGSWLAQSAAARINVAVDGSVFDPDGSFAWELEIIFGRGCVSYVGDLRGDVNGRPYVNNWFSRALFESSTYYVCAVNADIVLPRGWLDMMMQIWGNLMRIKPTARPMIMGSRERAWPNASLNLNLNLEAGSVDEWVEGLERVIENHKWVPFHSKSSDFFFMGAKLPPFDIRAMPPFVMGCFGWDSWMLGQGARGDGVSADAVTRCLHFEHRNSLTRKSFPVQLNLRFWPQARRWLRQNHLRWVAKI